MEDTGLEQQALAHVDKCNRCGFCRGVCPLLEEIGAESGAPRGRVFLAGQILTGAMPMTLAVADRLGRCLVCRHCTAFCPLGVRVDLVMMAARSRMARTLGEDRLKGALLKTLACRWNATSSMLPVLAVLQGIVLRRSATDEEPPGPDGLVRPVGPARSVGPAGPVGSIRPVSSVRSTGPARPRVAFFAGCFVNFVAPEVGRATLRVLEENGVKVLVPERQTCCGTPMLAAGNLSRALPAIRQNIDTLLAEKPDAIVTSCASCGTSLKEWWEDILTTEGDEVYLAKAREIARRTFDISEFLAEQVDLKTPPALQTPLKVTYHDACHLVHGRNIRSQPRQILQKIPGLTLVEMPGADECCGCGGLFSYSEYALAKKVNARKIKNIALTGADAVVSGCPGCNLQIRDGLNRFQVAGRVLHTVEVLDQAYRGE
ncbi:MAG: (Fe-S)-binding protein [Firmicutes bacterium]|nr:(Fe-S)-binding protein [Bacillota bacterium]